MTAPIVDGVSWGIVTGIHHKAHLEHIQTGILRQLGDFHLRT